MSFFVSFSVKLQIVRVLLAPIKRPFPARFLPGGIFLFFILEIVRVSLAPGGHIVKLSLVLAFYARTDLLVRPVFVGNKGVPADFTNLFFGHVSPLRLLKRFPFPRKSFLFHAISFSYSRQRPIPLISRMV